MDSALCLDLDFCSRRKCNQSANGDAFASQRIEGGRRLIAVLSDGLGSGIKACLLATLTARMALRFAAAGADPERYLEVMLDSLPVCRVRKIAYATFTIVDGDSEGLVRVIEEGNPPFIHLRGSSPAETAGRTVFSRRYPDRRMLISELGLAAGDRLIACSDGVTQAGMGTQRLRLGWRREGLRDFAASAARENPGLSSRELGRRIVERAIELEPNGEPLDDVSCLTLHYRRPRRLLVLTGPPYDQSRDAEYAGRLDSFPGRKAVCGGATANLVARELGRRLELDLASFNRRSLVPPASLMEGVDLVTEGIITLTRAAGRLENPEAEHEEDAAGRLVDLLLDSDSVEFLAGTRINEAHQDPSLPADLDIRRNILRRICEVLKTRYLKEVSLAFI
ncbi:MAG: serine/threonine-protein phosphatase [Planctomycetota bacterium]|jgi:hypothetical protein|nr:serine/threonine-protein phosphatase [Planctomycetota bacterium]